jgi:hypothetical protein
VRFETRKFLKQFDLMIDQAAAEKGFGIFQDALQRVLDETGLIGQSYDSDGEALPEILMFNFRNGHIEFFAQAIFQAAQNLPLILERMCFRKMNLER